jgi:hypothetical protein
VASPRSYGVLASSDVIGMGLNLSIRRVVFASLHKFDGEARRPLTPPEVKQIAGRAGRYGGRYSRGEVTTLSGEDLPALRAALAAPAVTLEHASTFPPVEAILAAAASAPAAGLEGALRRLAGAQPCAAHYAQHQPDDVIALARLLAPLPLPLPAALTLALAPCDARDPGGAAALLAYASALSRGGPVRVDAGAAPTPLAPPRTQAELAALEGAFRTYDLYVWLALRMVRAHAHTHTHTRARCHDAHPPPAHGLHGCRWHSLPARPSRAVRPVRVCVRAQPQEFPDIALAEAMRDAAGAAVQEGLRLLARPPASLARAKARCVRALRVRDGAHSLRRACAGVT